MSLLMARDSAQGLTQQDVAVAGADFSGGIFGDAKWRLEVADLQPIENLQWYPQVATAE